MVERLTLQVTEFEDTLQELGDQNQSLRNRNSLLAQEMEAVQEEVGGVALCPCCVKMGAPAVHIVSILASRFYVMHQHHSLCVCKRMGLRKFNTHECNVVEEERTGLLCVFLICLLSLLSPSPSPTTSPPLPLPLPHPSPSPPAPLPPR